MLLKKMQLVITYFIILHAVLVVNTTHVTSFSRRPSYNSKSCNIALGMSDGGISNDQIKCGYSFIDSSEPICGKCYDARYHLDHSRRELNWWCSKDVASENMWYQVTFEKRVYIETMKVESYANLLDTTDNTKYHPNYFHVLHSLHTDNPDDFRYLYDSYTKQNKKFHITNNGVKNLKIDEWAYYLKLEVHENDDNWAALRFEFYGCPHYASAKPLGMKNGQIADGQIMSSFGPLTQIVADGSFLNPWGGRLDSGGDGWLSKNTFYRVNLKNGYMIAYMEYNVINMGIETATFKNLVFKYAITQNAFQIVTEIVENTENEFITVPSFSTLGSPAKYVFKNSIHARFIEIGVICAADCPTFKFEFYGAPSTVGDHEWNFIGDSYADKSGYLDISKRGSKIEVKYPYIELEFGGDIKHSSGETTTGYITPSDCLLSPENCDKGLTISFLAKMEHTTRGKFTGGIKTNTIVHYDDVNGCVDMSSSSLNLKSSLSFYFENFKLEQYARVSDAYFDLYGPKKHNLEISLRVHVYFNVPKTFITECHFKTLTIKPLISMELKTNKKNNDKGVTRIKMTDMLNRLLGSPMWEYESSFAILFETDYALEVVRKDNPEANIAYTYSLPACDFSEYDIVENLNISRFQSNGYDGCSGNDFKIPPHEIKFSENGWIMCNTKQDWLIIDLGTKYLVTMIKIASLGNSIDIKALTEFYFWTSNNGIDFKCNRIYFGQNACHVFKRKWKNNNRAEYLPLRYPVTTQWIKLTSMNNKFIGKAAGIRFDIVACRVAPKQQERRWVEIKKNVCLKGKGNNPGEIIISNAYDISFFKYANARGGFSSAPSSTLRLNFGNKIGVYVTNKFQSEGNYPSIIAPVYASAPGITADTEEWSIKTKYPVYVKSLEKLYLWHMDDLVPTWDNDNDDGEICLDLYGWAKTQPGSYVVLDCQNNDKQCPCLGVENQRLIFNNDCTDLFYFDIYDHMVHVGTGTCVIVLSDDTLGLDNTTCLTEFNKGDRDGQLLEKDSSKCVGKGALGNAKLTLCGVAESYHFVDYLFDDMNYHVLSQRFVALEEDNSITREEAKTKCEEAGLVLPSINTVTKQKVWCRMLAENDYILNNHAFWLGMFSENNNGVYLWDDDSPMDTTVAPLVTTDNACMRWRGGQFESEPCGQTAKVICQVRSIKPLRHPLVTSGLHRTNDVSFGQGFQVSLSDDIEDHIEFTVQTATSFYEISAPSQKNHYHHYTLTWEKSTGTIQIYIDGELVKKQTGHFLRPKTPEFQIENNFINFMSYYDITVTDFRHNHCSLLKIWRHLLEPGDVKKLTQTEVTFSEMHDNEIGSYDGVKINSIRSDPSLETGPIHDVTIRHINVDANLNKIDGDDCVWKNKKFNGESEELAGIFEQNECVMQCRIKQLNDEGFTAVAYGIKTPNKGRCFCVKHDSLINRNSIGSPLDSDYKTCFLKMKVYNGRFLGNDEILYVTTDIDNRMVYGLNGALYYLRYDGSILNWKSAVNQVLKMLIFVHESEYWCLTTTNKINKNCDNSKNHADFCSSFGVDENYLYCIKVGTNELYKKVKEISGAWELLLSNANEVISTFNQAYVKANDIIYMLQPNTNHLVQLTDPVTSDCYQAFSVSPNHKVVFADCNGMYVFKGHWHLFVEGNFRHVHCIDDNFVYAVGSNKRIYQFAMEAVKIPGYSAYTFETDYENAMKKCESQNGHLVTLKSTGEITVVRSMTTQRYTYVGAYDEDMDNLFKWNDGTPVRQEFFHNTGPTDTNEQCVALIDDWDRFADITCSVTCGYLCQVNDVIQLKREVEISFFSVVSSTACIDDRTVEEIEFPAYESGEEGVKSVMWFKKINLTSNDYAVNTYLKFYPTEDSLITNTFQYVISIRMRESPYHCSLSANTIDQELVTPIIWNIKSQWKEGVPVKTPDLSSLVNFMLRKPSWNEDKKLAFVFTPNVSDETADYSNKINMSKTGLFISYKDHYPNRYACFHSSYSEAFVPKSFIVSPFYSATKAISFWLFMKGPDCGTLFVKMDEYHRSTHKSNKILLELSGSQGNYWKKITLQTDLANKRNLFYFEFFVFNNLGPKGHICIDNIQGLTYLNPDELTTFGVSKYDPNDRTNYRTVLTDLGYSIPVFLYPFTTGPNLFKDYGPHQLDLTKGRHDGYTTMKDSFYYKNHMLNIYYHKHRRNIRYFNDDVSTATNKFTSSGEFSFLFHLYNVKPPHHQYAAIFVFSDPSSEKKFRVTTTMDSLLLLVVDGNGNTVLEEMMGRMHYKKFYYIAITYKQGIIMVFFDKELVNMFTIDHAVLRIFPTKLSIVRDPDDDVLETDPKRIFHQYIGGISCFRGYDETLTVQDIRKYAFCSNREDEKYHRTVCPEYSSSVIFISGCVCSDYISRYIDDQCNSAFMTVYQNAVAYESFDKLKNNNQLDLGAGELRNQNDSKLMYIPGPVNAALCIFRSDLTHLILIQNTCMYELTDCPDGFHNAFWFFVDETAINNSLLWFYQHGLRVINMDNHEYNVTVEFLVLNCESIEHVIGLKTWNHVIFVFPNSNSYELYLNGQRIDEKSCDARYASNDQLLKVGGAVGTGRTCIDEFVVNTNADVPNPVDFYYTSVIKGTFSYDEKPLKGKKTEIKAKITVDAPITEGYKNEYADIYSEPSQIMRTLIDGFLRQELSNIGSANYHSVRLERLSAKDWVDADVIISFDHFGLEEVTFMDSCLHSSYYDERWFYYCSEWQAHVGLSTAEISHVESVNLNELIIYMKTTPEQLRYHLGYRVVTFREKPDGTIKNETFEFYTGVDVLNISVEIYKNYDVKVWPISHEGYGKSDIASFLSAGKENDYPISGLRAEAVSSTELLVEWDEYPKDMWNGPDLTYLVSAKPYINDDIYLETRNVTRGDTIVYMNHNTFRFNIIDLEIFTLYFITISSLNSYGESPLANITCRTSAGTPEVAPNITDLRAIDNTVQITWEFTDISELWNAFTFDGFEIKISEMFQNRNYVADLPLYILGNDTFTLTTDALDYYALYNVEIQAFTVAGSGVKNKYCFATEPFYAATGPNVANLIGAESRNITLDIGRIRKRDENGVIESYQVVYTSIDWADTNKTINTDMIVHSFEDMEFWNSMIGIMNCTAIEDTFPQSSLMQNITIENLVPYTNYRFIISGCNQEKGCAEHGLTVNNVMLEGTTVVYRTIPDIPGCSVNGTFAQNTSSTSVYIEWSHLTNYCKHGDLKFYHIGWLDAYIDSSLISNPTLIDNSTTLLPNLLSTLENHTDVFGLRKYWNYSLFVIFENQVGNGTASELVWFLTNEDVPEGAPINVNGEAFNNTALSINITLPVINLRNGIILGYHVKLVNAINEVNERNYSVESYAYWNELGVPLQIIFPGLREYFNHSVTVRAYTSVGMGPEFDPVIMRTAEAVPTASPIKFTSLSTTNDTITLEWFTIPYLSKHGVMQHFIINASAILANDTLHTIGPINFTDFTDAYFKDYHFDIGSLFPHTLYNFTLKGCTVIGCSPQTDIYDIQTQEMEPSEAPLEIIHLDSIEETLSVEFSDILFMGKRGKVIGFNISYTKQSMPWEKESHEPVYRWFNGTGFRDVLNNLENYTNYAITIAGVTKIGQGPFSEEFVFETVENVPSATPVVYASGFISASSLFFNFTGIAREYHEGVLLGYRVYYFVDEEIGPCLNRDPFEECSKLMMYKTANVTDITLEPLNYTVKLYGLDNSIMYTACIRAFTTAGEGPVSECFSQYTDSAVHGNWSEWTEWGSCDLSCGKGKQRKYRWCINPEPWNGGDYCEGPDVAFIPCNEQPCPDFYLADPGIECSETCENLLPNFICNPSIDKDIQNSTDLFKHPRIASNHTHRYNLTCVNTNEPIYNETSHPSYNMNEQSCDGFIAVPRQIECSETNLTESQQRLCFCDDKDAIMFFQWAPWSPCSKPCGVGSKSRFRECAFDETECNMEKATHREDCNTHLCPIDGGWSEWSPWSNCSKSCGFGEIIRTRVCDNPKPQFEGRDCPFSDVDSRRGCNPYPCKVDGGWSSWRPVEKCTQPCGIGGTQRKIRYCDSPLPEYDGDYCIGERYNLTSCNEHIPCNDIEATFVLKFVNEVWNFRMVYDTTPERRAFSDYLSNAINSVMMNNTNITNTVKGMTINKLTRGSVIANFTLKYDAVNFAQVVVLQHAIEIQRAIDTMSLIKLNMTSNDIPSAPTNVSGISLTPFTINITWNALSKNLTGGDYYLFYVYYRQIRRYIPDWDVVGVNESTSLQLFDLLPGSLYGIRVLTAVERGNGFASEEIQVSTIEGVPYIAPPDFTKYVMSYSSIFLTWLPIPTSQVPGRLLGYKISYRKYNGNVTTELIVGPTMNLRSLKGLTPFTFYWIEVTGFTSAGDGPSSLIVLQMPPGPPGIAPPNITVFDLYSTSKLRLYWDAIPSKFQYGYMQGYKVTYEIIQQSGKEVMVGIPVTEVYLDSYTFSYEIEDLLAYSKYRVTLCGYSPQGDGPKFVTEIETCKCPPIIYTNFYELQPYMNYKNEIPEGLFPDIIPMIINNVCTGCKSYSKSILYFNKTYSGHPSRKLNEIRVRGSIGSSAHLNFPIHSKMDMERFQGVFPYIGIVPKQGVAMVVYHEKIQAVGAWHILVTVFSAWPVILVCVLMALVFGCAFWFTEQFSEESDINTSSILVGSLQGFWLAFITMTTLGYGDFVPSSNLSKVLMVLWVLIGLVSISMFTGVVSSGLTASGIGGSVMIYGTSTAVVQYSKEQQLAVLRNADMSHNNTYNTTLKVLQAVSNKEVELGLIDANSAGGYEDLMQQLNLKIQEILDMNGGYGVVLSDGLESIEDDIRGFVISNQAMIQEFVKQRVSQLIPFLVETETELITREEFLNVTQYLAIIFAVVWFSGLTVWLLCKNCRKKKIAPSVHDGNLLMNKDTLDIINTTFGDMVTEFAESFKSNLSSLEIRQKEERSDLCNLHKSYKRLLIRTGYTDHQVVSSFEKNRQQQLHNIRKKLKRKRQDVAFDYQFKF